MNLPKVEQVFKSDLSSKLINIIITPEVVEEKIKILRSNKALDMDGLISNFSLRTSETTCVQLNIIFRNSLVEGVVQKD